MGYNCDDADVPGELSVWSLPGNKQLGYWDHGGYNVATDGDDSFILVEATDPLEFPTVPFNKSEEVGVGPGMSFAYTYTTLTGNNVTLIPCAVGGTTLYQWTPSDDPTTLYGDCTTRVNFVTALPGYTLGGILWLQGEQDVMNPNTNLASYVQNLTALIASWRHDLTGGSESTPFVAGQMEPLWVMYQIALGQEIQAVITNLPFTIPYTSVVYGLNTTGVPLPFGCNSAPIHYSGASQRIIGQAYASALLAASHNYVGSTTPGKIVQVFILPISTTTANISWTPDPVASFYRITLISSSTPMIITNPTSSTVLQVAPCLMYNTTVAGCLPSSCGEDSVLYMWRSLC